MPYEITKGNSVVSAHKKNGKTRYHVLGRHKTHGQAVAQLRAIAIHTHGKHFSHRRSGRR